MENSKKILIKYKVEPEDPIDISDSEENNNNKINNNNNNNNNNKETKKYIENNGMIDISSDSDKDEPNEVCFLIIFSLFSHYFLPFFF